MTTETTATTTTLTITVPTTITRVLDGVGTYKLDWAHIGTARTGETESDVASRLSDVATYLFQNGFSQSIADSIAGKKGAAAKAAADAKFAAICSGTIGTRAAADPLGAAIRSVLETPGKKFRQGDKVVAWTGLTKTERAAKIAAVRGATEGTPMMADLVEAKRRMAAGPTTDDGAAY